jgi:hypothetical protein
MIDDFVGKLKWRKDARVAVVYAATAFVVLHAADLLTSGLRLPEWVFTTVAVLLVFGFPIAVVLGWVLEVTPEGVRVTTSAPAGTAEPQFCPFGRRTVVPDGHGRVDARSGGFLDGSRVS